MKLNEKKTKLQTAFAYKFKKKSSFEQPKYGSSHKHLLYLIPNHIPRRPKFELVYSSRFAYKPPKEEKLNKKKIPKDFFLPTKIYLNFTEMQGFIL